MGADDIFEVNGWVLVAVGISLYVALAVVTRLVGERIVTPSQRPGLTAVVGPLTPALAALFSVLVAFTVVTEAGYLRTGQVLASDEAAAASRLGWASTNRGVEGVAIRAALVDYLDVVVRSDWSGQSEAARTPAPVVRALRRIESRTRAQVAAPEVATPVATELLGALDSLTTTRRQLVAEATRRIALSYLLMLAIAGAALVGNVALLTVAVGRRGLWLGAGVVLVVSTALALLVGISASFAGPLRVDHAAIDRVIVDLRSGVFATR